MRVMIAALSLLAAVSAAPLARSAYDFTMTTIDGQPMPLAQYKGKVVLVVNTASFCGFTPQYEGLEKLQEAYAGKGFTIVGVPSGDFGGQEYAKNGEIKQFCKSKFGIRFPLTEKADVVGANAAPFYKWASATLGDSAVPKWNFHKILVGRDGRLLGAWPSAVEPESPVLTAAIGKALAG